MMHPDHIELIRRIMNFGMALICAAFAAKILKAIFWEVF